MNRKEFLQASAALIPMSMFGFTKAEARTQNTTAVPFASENQGLKFNAQVAASEFNVFSVTGKFLGRMNFTGADTKNTAFANEMKQAGYTNGVYIVRAVKGEKALKIVVKE